MSKILLLDIETSPSLGAYFQLYKEGNIVWTEKDWYVLSWVAKWAGEKTIISRSLPDYPGYKPGKENDKLLMHELWNLIDEADVVVAHNGDRFDIKKINTRFLLHGLTSPSPYKTVDTKKVAKLYFGFDSNKLTDLGRQLGLGEKEDTGGINLWKDCLAGNMKAWEKMMKYNKQDVLLLEKIYLRLRPWQKNHPYTGEGCPNCNSFNLQRRGMSKLKGGGQAQRYHCQSCGAWTQARLTKSNPDGII